MSIVLQNLNKRYADQMIVDRVSVEIADGELFVLLGPSGSGKSTILRMIAGLTPVTEGRIILHGRDVTDLSPQQRGTGFVFQNYSLFRHMTVADNIEFGLTIRKTPKRERAARRDELLDIVGLAGMGGRYPSQLSGGQQQRVAVARALAFEPSVLLLDEPFGALDVQIRGQLRQSLKEIQRRLGVTTILVTHDQEEAFELADRIGIIDHGRLLEVGVPDELYRRPQHEFVATFLGTANLLAGTYERENVRLGSLTLPYQDPVAHFDAEGRTEVLFRPEDLIVASERRELEGPALGAGTVEEVLFLGTMQRIRVRLDPLPGTWPLPLRYGQEGILLNVVRLSLPEGMADVKVGQKVWVGIKHFHILPRIALRLLVCTDGSADAEEAMRLAARLGQDTGGTMTVLAVGEDQSHIEETHLAQARQLLKAVDPDLHVLARRGVATDEILEEMKTGSYDLVIVGGRKGLSKHDSPGKTLERLVQESPLPLLVVKGTRPAIKRVLLCSAGGEASKIDVLFGARLARRAGAAATLLHVETRAGRSRYTTAEIPATNGASKDGQIPAEHPLPEANLALSPALPTEAKPSRRTESWPGAPWLSRHLEGGRVTLLGQGVRVDTKIRYGTVVDEILAEAAEGEYDLLVVGGHIPSSPALLRERDLAAEVVAQADRPVLVVRGKVL